MGCLDLRRAGVGGTTEAIGAVTDPTTGVSPPTFDVLTVLPYLVLFAAGEVVMVGPGISSPTKEDDVGLNIQDLEISSPAFDATERIPTKHTVDGEDVSPPLQWTGVPDGTVELALVCHDPDAPLPRGFTHWLVYNIPADVTQIEEGGGKQFTEGKTDFGDTGYGGPACPEGHGVHHYYFWLYALDNELAAEPGITRGQLLERIEDRIIEQNRIVGTYER